MVVSGRFAGFSPQAIQFLADLGANNDRAWFQPRKADYERLLKEPLEALCVDLDAAFAAQGLPLRADPARSPFRIYRDTRFSKDKSPYKPYLSAIFPWASASGGWPEDRLGVGAYFHLQPGEIFAGGGMWHPETPKLAAWRALVDRDPARVHEVIDDPAFVREFGAVSGERLKRVPSGFTPDHPEAELLKMKDVTFGRPLADVDVFSPELPAELARIFATAVPLLGLLANLPG